MAMAMAKRLFICCLTPFEIPALPDLVIKPGNEKIDESARKLIEFIKSLM